MATKSLVFVSYARASRGKVGPIVNELRALGVDVWIDVEQLRPGQDWDQQVYDALRASRAILFFISPATRRSSYIQEFRVAKRQGLLMLPVLIEGMKELPAQLREFQWLDGTDLPPQQIAKEIFRNLSSWSEETVTTKEVGEEEEKEEEEEEIENLAEAIAAQAREVPVAPEGAAPNSIFLVHGHDDQLLREVAEFVKELGIEAIILKE